MLQLTMYQDWQEPANAHVGGTAAVQSSNSTQLVRKELCLSRERLSESCYFISGSMEIDEEEEEIPGCWRASPLTHPEFEHSDQVC